MYYSDIISSGVDIKDMTPPMAVGRSETVPNAAISLVELYRRSVLGQITPDVAFPVETGDDEDFDDAFEAQDIIDVYENSQKISYLQEKIANVQKMKKAKQAENEMKGEAKAADSISEDEKPKN